MIPNDLDQQIAALEQQGKTAMIAGIHGSLAGVIAVSDRVKPEAKSVLAALRSMNIAAWMVTGDNKRTAHAIARELGLPQECVFAEVQPAHKSGFVEKMKASGHVVAMVGDGIKYTIVLITVLILVVTRQRLRLRMLESQLVQART